MKLYRYILALGLAFLFLSESVFAVGYSLKKDPPSLESRRRAKPFRSFFLKLDPNLDQQKPLAAADFGGMVTVSDLIIGAYSEQWLGGFSFKAGDQKWRLKMPASLSAPPSVVGSWVFFAFQDGTVMKVEALTGKKLWSAELGSFVSRSLRPAGSSVIAVTAAQNLYSLDFQTGKIKWIYDVGFPQGVIVHSLAAPLVYKESVIVGTSSGEVVAVSLSEGKLKWKFNLGYTKDRFSDVVGEMTVVNERLLISRYDGLVASLSLRGETRKLAWSKKFPSVATSVFRNGRFYLGLVNGDLLALQVADGHTIWKSKTGQTISVLTAGERKIYVAGSSGRVTALFSSDGKLAWQDELGGVITTPTFYYGKNLFFSTGGHNLYGYKIR